MAETVRVRDMYEGDDYRKTKKYRDARLKENPDVLFRIYQKKKEEKKLHVLLLMPSDPAVWTRVILNNTTTDKSFQLTVGRLQNGHLPVINMSGPEHELEQICDTFDQLYNRVMENMNEMEELNARIQELELENNNLRGQLVCMQKNNKYLNINE